MSKQLTHLPTGSGSAGREVIAHLAASVMVLRGEPFEVLLMRRSDESTFVPGAWIFPGGSLDPHDAAIADALALTTQNERLKITATRELLEESGLWLGGTSNSLDQLRKSLSAAPGTLTPELLEPALVQLTWTSRWITPVGMPKRYDTYFYLATVPENQVATPDHVEGMELRWLTPDNALQLNRNGELPMVLPTVKNIAALKHFGRINELLASRRDVVIEPIQPRLVSEDGKKRIVLPSES